MLSNVSTLFYNNWINIEKYKILINQGGTYSGKNWDILLVILCMVVERPNLRVTVTGQSIPNIKRGALRDLQNILKRDEYSVFNQFIKQYNKTERTYYFKNGAFIEFTIFTSEQDAKNGKRDVLYINEANGVDWPIAEFLIQKSEVAAFVDYNPTCAFWAHDKLLIRKDCIRIISDHRNNKFISNEIHNEIENHPDPEWHKVYARGLTGNITGIVFPNWKQMEGEEWRKEIKEIVYGIDYGYTNDPTCILKIYVLSKFEVVLEELMYTPSSDDEFISEVLFKSGYSAESCVYCDHDKSVNSQLQRRNINIHNAIKTDRAFAIQKIRGIQVWYTPNSVNVHKERSRYVFKKTNEISLMNCKNCKPYKRCTKNKPAAKTNFWNGGWTICRG